MTALKLLSNRAGVTWLILVAATIVSWAVGAEHGTGSAVAVLVLAIAAVKVRLVGLDFMELRHAPIPLRAAFRAVIRLMSYSYPATTPISA